MRLKLGISINIVHNTTYANLILCDDRTSQWCCAYNGNCCNNAFTMHWGTIIQPPQISTQIATGGASSVSAQASGAGTISTSTSASLTPSSTSKISIIIGTAVGIPLGIAVLAVLSFLLYREHRLRKAAESCLANPSTSLVESRPPHEIEARPNIYREIR